jgi:RHS repeat-associated protein
VLGGNKKFWGNTYSYDAWGNLTNKTKIGTACAGENLVVTADAHNWIHATGGADYLYDAAGNMTFNATPPTQTYSYDQENRLTGAAGYAYTYDADGNRVRKSNASAGTLYWYMTPGIVGESDLNGNLTDEYIFFDGERVARKSTNGVFYYFSDHLKTASVITDSAGVIKAESDYYPWGGELQFVNNDSNHYKFTGKERDSETQLDYFGARHYSNGLGRFVTPDWAAKATAVPYAEFADPQSLNLYTYVRNIPTTRYDPDGHDPLLAIDIIQFVVAHFGHVGTVEGNVRSGYNARIAETKANQGGNINSAQRAAIQQEARQGSTSTGKALAAVHDAKTAAVKEAKAAAGALEESAGRTNPGFNAAGNIGKVAGPIGTAVAIGIAAKNVADAPPGQKLETGAKEGGGIAGAIAGGELGAAIFSETGPGAILGGAGGGGNRRFCRQRSRR